MRIAQLPVPVQQHLIILAQPSTNGSRSISAVNTSNSSRTHLCPHDSSLVSTSVPQLGSVQLSNFLQRDLHVQYQQAAEANSLSQVRFGQSNFGGNLANNFQQFMLGRYPNSIHQANRPYNSTLSFPRYGMAYGFATSVHSLIGGLNTGAPSWRLSISREFLKIRAQFFGSSQRKVNLSGVTRHKHTLSCQLAREKGRNMDTKPVEISSFKMFGGYNKRFNHFSPTLGCSMTFHIFFPPSPSPSHKFPVLYWLSGLTCTDENFIIKSGAQRAASDEGIALVAPDTSPRGLNVEGEADSWDFGVGAGFYVNARQEKWKNWQMYDYVVKELPKLLSDNFTELETSKASIFGHSMGGHGALTIYLKNLDKYKSVSAFSPIANPINCAWGQKAFTNYLGGNKSDWEEYDATCLIKKFRDVSTTILIDQGEDDKFLHDQLLPHKFEEACRNANVPLLLRFQPGYDHSYYFIATFIDDHIRHHAQALRPS